MSLRKQASSGMIWTFSQQFGNQLITFVVSIILARLLLPEEFGLIGMIIVFIAIGQSLVDSGMTQSLIRSTNIDQEDLSTVFFFNLAASIIIYVIVYLVAPFIAEFYDQEVLTNLIRVLCITFIISAFSAVQGARFSRNMDFKTITVISIPSTILSGILGIVLAYMGYGVWSLVWSRISGTFLNTIQFWIYSKWSPTFIFKKEKLKEHFNFGYKLTLSSLLDTIYNNIYLIVIGKFFAASSVGFYTRAQSLQKLPVQNISKALNKVTYPLFSQIKDDDIRLKRVYKVIMQSVIFVIAPILIFASVLAVPTFRFLLTEKWLPAVPFFQILCIVGVLYPLNSYNLNVLKVKGRSDLFLKLEVIKKILVTISIVIAIQYGIYGLLYSQVLLAIIGFFINSQSASKFIQYSSWEQLKDILPIIFLASVAGGGIYFLDQNSPLNQWPDILRIIIGGFVGIIIYFPLIYLYNKHIILDLKKMIYNK